MSRARLLVVCGPPGVGKTTLSSEIMHQGSALALSSDLIATTLKRGLPGLYDISPDEALVAAGECMIAIWRQALSVGVTCIHDATIPSISVWKDLRRACDDVRARMDVIQLDASDPILIARASDRFDSHVRPFSASLIVAEAARARLTYAEVAATRLASSYHSISTDMLSVNEVRTVALDSLRREGFAVA